MEVDQHIPSQDAMNKNKKMVRIISPIHNSPGWCKIFMSSSTHSLSFKALMFPIIDPCPSSLTYSKTSKEKMIQKHNRHIYLRKVSQNSYTLTFLFKALISFIFLHHPNGFFLGHSITCNFLTRLVTFSSNLEWEECWKCNITYDFSL